MISLRIRIRMNAALRAKDKTRGVRAPLNLIREYKNI